MKAQNQSASVSLGQNTTPTSTVCHPKDKKFYVTVNSSGKTPDTHLSIVEFEQSQDRSRLLHKAILFNDRLEKSVFIPNTEQLLLMSTESSGNTGLTMLLPSEELKPVKAFPEKFRNVIVSKNGEVLMVGENSISKFDLEKGDLTSLLEAPGSDLSYTVPVNQNQICCAFNRQNRISFLDKLNKAPQIKIENAHNSPALCIDFNPSKQNYIMVTYQDCIKFWDLKKPNIPLKCIDNHHSLLLSAKYNFYDELVLAAYDDGTVGLFRITSLSSAAAALSSNKQQDGLVKLYDQHEDSVYNICWAIFSPWHFTSVSYNSNMIINLLPIAEKHRILF